MVMLTFSLHAPIYQLFSLIIFKDQYGIISKKNIFSCGLICQPTP